MPWWPANAFLAAHAAAFAPGRRHVVPTCVDPARYPCPARRGRAVQLVWIGSGSTIRGLETMQASSTTWADSFLNSLEVDL